MPKTSVPTVIMVVAILQLVFGGMQLICDLCGGVSIAASRSGLSFTPRGAGAAMQFDVEQEMKKLSETRFAGHRSFQVGNAIASLVLSILTIVSGIALLGMKGWGRILAIGSALGRILLSAADLAEWFLVVLPVTYEIAEMLEKHEPQAAPVARLMPVIGYVSAVFKLLVMVSPAIVLILLVLPSTSAAFRSENDPDAGERTPDLRDEREDGDSPGI